MTSLESFLNNEKKPSPKTMEPASGSFKCQAKDCEEIVYDGYIDRDNNRLVWKCSQNHESSVII